MYKIVFLFVLLIVNQILTAQIGGGQAYNFLKMPTNARSTALGGNLISVRDNDVNLVADNPAVLNSEMHNHFALNYLNYFSSINYGQLAYAYDSKKIGTYALGMQYLSYGKFTETNEAGDVIGEFSAGEYAFDFSYAYELSKRLRVGGTGRFIYSGLGPYSSLGAGITIGAHYTAPEDLFTAGVVLKNAGYQFKPYVSGQRQNMPFQIQMAASYKLPLAPIRFTFMLNNMQRWDLTSDVALDGVPTLSQTQQMQVEPANERFFTFEKFARHLVFGAEILPSEKFHIRAGFNYLRRAELAAVARGGAVGLSFGAGIKIKKFIFNYGLASYHLAGTSHHISIVTNISELRTRTP